MSKYFIYAISALLLAGGIFLIFQSQTNKIVEAMQQPQPESTFRQDSVRNILFIGYEAGHGIDATNNMIIIAAGRDNQMIFHPNGDIYHNDHLLDNDHAAVALFKSTLVELLNQIQLDSHD